MSGGSFCGISLSLCWRVLFVLCLLVCLAFPKRCWSRIVEIVRQIVMQRFSKEAGKRGMGEEAKKKKVWEKKIRQGENFGSEVLWRAGLFQ